MSERQKRIQRWRRVGCDLLNEARNLAQLEKAMAWLQAANDLEMEGEK